LNKPLALSQSIKMWEQWFQSLDEKPYRAKQVIKWMYVDFVFDPSQFLNIKAPLRLKLAESFDWTLPSLDSALKSSDESEKFLFKTIDGQFFECVLMPFSNRVTLCVSSQVGCKLGCRFCQTGKMGFTRHLSLGEILFQAAYASNHLRTQNTERKLTNIVFMGMGEPLDNYDAVVESCKHFIDKNFFNLSHNKVTISTSGLIPQIEQLGRDLPIVPLAISLHSADNELRSQMMPINKKYPLPELRKTLLNYPIQNRHGITFEYIMIKNKNDSVEHAKKLVNFLKGIKAKVNLIPMNTHPGIEMEASEEVKLKDFQKYLSTRGYPAPIRYSRGQDVSAACGQLASKKKDELDFTPRSVARLRKSAV